MSETQQQNIVDIIKMINKLESKEIESIKNTIEKSIDQKLLTLAPDAILENIDITEKLMLIDYYSKSEEERKELEEETIPMEEMLREEETVYRKQKVIIASEIESTIEEYNTIIDPIIVKRDNCNDLVILNREEYDKQYFFEQLEKKLKEAEDDIKNGRVRPAREVFKELREKYGY